MPLLLHRASALLMDLPSVTSCSVKDVFSISFYYLNEIKALWQDRGVCKARCADNSSRETKPKVPFTMHRGLMSCKRAKMSGRAKFFVLCLMRKMGLHLMPLIFMSSSVSGAQFPSSSAEEKRRKTPF